MNDLDCDPWGPVESKFVRFLTGAMIFMLILLAMVQLYKWLGI